MLIKNKKALIVVIPLILLGILIFILNSKKEKVIEREIVKSPTVTNYDNSLPESFPDDFPIYPNALVVSASKTTNDEKQGLSVAWEVEASTREVFDFYSTQLVAKGWEVGEESGSVGNINFQKNSTYGFLAIVGNTTKSTIVVTLGLK